MISPISIPPEIEDEIFKWVVSSRPYRRSDVLLATISKRVKLCVEPILYRTLKFHGNRPGVKLAGNIEERYKLVHEDKFAIALHSKPPSFFRDNVKNVLFVSTVTTRFAHELLSICTGVRHLLASFKIDNPFVPILAVLPLTSIDIDVRILDMLAKEKIELVHVTYIGLGGRSLFYDEDVDIIQPGSVQWLPSVTHVEIPVSEYNEYFTRTLATLIKDITGLRCITVTLQEFHVWGEDTGVPELIEEWLELDTRVEVVKNIKYYIPLWEDMIDKGWSSAVRDARRFRK